MLKAILTVKDGVVQPVIFENEPSPISENHATTFQGKNIKTLARRIIKYCINHNLPFEKGLPNLAKTPIAFPLWGTAWDFDGYEV